MKTTILILLLLNWVSPPNRKQEVIGIYTSPKNTIVNKVKYGQFVTDLQVELKADNTYIFKTCSQISQGKWKYSNNSIQFYCENRRFIVDSLNYIERYKKGRICSDEAYKVSKGQLFNERRVNNHLIKFILLKE